jgi:hypothetical protein
MPVTFGSSAFTPDGKLWIATTQGLASIDLPHITRTEQRPLIHVVGVTVSRSEQEATPELILPTGTHHLELNFDAVEIGSPEKIRLQSLLSGCFSEESRNLLSTSMIKPFILGTI